MTTEPDDATGWYKAVVDPPRVPGEDEPDRHALGRISQRAYEAVAPAHRPPRAGGDLWRAECVCNYDTAWCASRQAAIAAYRAHADTAEPRSGFPDTEPDIPAGLYEIHLAAYFEDGTEMHDRWLESRP